ncbi:MAG: T9SS type A sorting domain-containing protein [Ignavibacteria bacterium]|nr:T9SS type A sorting domain-containing protein [Ignavibacteria bacterium]
MKFYPVLLIVVICLFQSIFGQTNPFYATNFLNTKPESIVFTDPYDSVYGTWNFIAPMNQQLLGVNAFYWSGNDKVFICGGLNQSSVPQNSCYWYNISANSYEAAASLPMGRWSGKLVRVKDSLYLIGSVDSTFSSADGLIYKYSLTQNTWELKDTMPQPFVHESAVCVVKDSLIAVIGGSTNSFLSPTKLVSIYDPYTDIWRSSSLFPINITASHSECVNVPDDTLSVIYTLGGYSSGNVDQVYTGDIGFNAAGDTITILWDIYSISLPFDQGIYRVAGAKWNEYMLFGPGVNGNTPVNQIWGLKYGTDTVWRKFYPNTIDTLANISTFGVKSGVDSNYFFLFGGYKNLTAVNTAQKFAFATPPPPIGIINIAGSIPEKFYLQQNYPNPFNPVTKIKFEVPENVNDNIMISVYDVLGREIALLVNENLKPGIYETSWDAIGVSSGLYFYRLIAGELIITRKMIVLK